MLNAGRNIPKVFLVAISAAFLACTPAPAPAPLPDAGDAGIVTPTPQAVHVCDAFRRLGCAEGAASCEVTISKVLGSTVTRFDAVCVIGAADKAAVRKCPAVNCP